MTNPILRWDNAYCPNCGKLTDITYDGIIDRRVKIYCKQCEAVFDMTWYRAHVNSETLMIEGEKE